MDAAMRAEVEKFVAEAFKLRFRDALEEYINSNELNFKDLVLSKRLVGVEDELKSLGEVSEVKFDASEKRFEALLREMNARFDAVDKRFSLIQWMLAAFIGIPASVIAVVSVIKIL